MNSNLLLLPNLLSRGPKYTQQKKKKENVHTSKSNKIHISSSTPMKPLSYGWVFFTDTQRYKSVRTISRGPWPCAKTWKPHDCTLCMPVSGNWKLKGHVIQQQVNSLKWRKNHKLCSCAIFERVLSPNNQNQYSFLIVKENTKQKDFRKWCSL